MRAIAIVNQKGGCGKTITAINLSAFLAMEQRRVLLVDMDPQGHATLGLLKDASRVQKTIYDVLTPEQEATAARDVIVPLRKNLDLIPADILLAALPEELAGTSSKDHRLLEALKDVRDAYDYIIVDCAPSVGPLTFNALKVCSEAIIPVEPSFFSLHGIGMQMETLDLLARKAGHAIEARALITLFTGRTEFVRAVAQEIRRHLGSRTFNTTIRFSGKLSEAAGHGLPIAEYSPRSAGFADYRALALEVIAQEAGMHVEVRPENSVVMQAAAVRESFITSPVEIAPVPEVERRIVASPPIPTSEGVLFTVEAPTANCVQLAADFNSWRADGNEMQCSDGVWTILVPLPPGRYHYQYVIDGGWRTDPLNADIEPTPWGGFNSVFTVEGNGAHGEIADNAYGAG